MIGKYLYEALFLRGLLFTIAIEVLVFLPMCYFWLNRKGFKALAYGAFVCCIATMLTLPYVWFIFPAFITIKVWYILASEVFAFIAEAIIYFLLLRCNFRQALFISLACNACSFGLGLLFFK